MRITDLIIDPRSLGSKLWLVDVIPSYEYRDNRKTENITGYRYVVSLPERSLDKINIKIDGKQLLEKPDGFVEVKCTDLEMFIYWLNGQPQVGAKATGIQLVNQKS